jgi:hypothetical protein
MTTDLLQSSRSCVKKLDSRLAQSSVKPCKRAGGAARVLKEKGSHGDD